MCSFAVSVYGLQMHFIISSGNYCPMQAPKRGASYSRGTSHFSTPSPKGKSVGRADKLKSPNSKPFFSTGNKNLQTSPCNRHPQKRLVKGDQQLASLKAVGIANNDKVTIPGKASIGSPKVTHQRQNQLLESIAADADKLPRLARSSSSSKTVRDYIQKEAGDVKPAQPAIKEASDLAKPDLSSKASPGLRPTTGAEPKYVEQASNGSIKDLSRAKDRGVGQIAGMSSSSDFQAGQSQEAFGTIRRLKQPRPESSKTKFLSTEETLQLQKQRSGQQNLAVPSLKAAQSAKPKAFGRAENSANPKGALANPDKAGSNSMTSVAKPQKPAAVIKGSAPASQPLKKRKPVARAKPPSQQAVFKPSMEAGAKPDMNRQETSQTRETGKTPLEKRDTGRGAVSKQKGPLVNGTPGQPGSTGPKDPSSKGTKLAQDLPKEVSVPKSDTSSLSRKQSPNSADKDADREVVLPKDEHGRAAGIARVLEPNKRSVKVTHIGGKVSLLPLGTLKTSTYKDALQSYGQRTAKQSQQLARSEEFFGPFSATVAVSPTKQRLERKESKQTYGHAINPEKRLSTWNEAVGNSHTPGPAQVPLSALLGQLKGQGHSQVQSVKHNEPPSTKSTSVQARNILASNNRLVESKTLILSHSAPEATAKQGRNQLEDRRTLLPIDPRAEATSSGLLADGTLAILPKPMAKITAAEEGRNQLESMLPRHPRLEATNTERKSRLLADGTSTILPDAVAKITVAEESRNQIESRGAMLPRDPRLEATDVDRNRRPLANAELAVLPDTMSKLAATEESRDQLSNGDPPTPWNPMSKNASPEQDRTQLVVEGIPIRLSPTPEAIDAERCEHASAGEASHLVMDHMPQATDEIDREAPANREIPVSLHLMLKRELPFTALETPLLADSVLQLEQPVSHTMETTIFGEPTIAGQTGSELDWDAPLGEMASACQELLNQCVYPYDLCTPYSDLALFERTLSQGQPVCLSTISRK